MRHERKALRVAVGLLMVLSAWLLMSRLTFESHLAACQEFVRELSSQ